jgi:hypothetical protein
MARTRKSSTYLPLPPDDDDYRSIKSNGMWYRRGQAGYADILERGFPKPKDRRTILAELHSPQVPAFLHGYSSEVPFLVNDAVREMLESAGLSGFSFARVVVAKVATAGKARRRTRGGEPEDAILKSRGVGLENAPRLHAVYVEATAEIRPEHESGRHPSDAISPFKLPKKLPRHDLWMPTYHGESFTAWAYCSGRFKDVCEAHDLTNIRFVPFAEHMQAFRNSMRDE